MKRTAVIVLVMILAILTASCSVKKPDITPATGKPAAGENTPGTEETARPSATDDHENGSKGPEDTSAPEGTSSPEDSSAPQDTSKPENTNVPSGTDAPVTGDVPESFAFLFRNGTDGYKISKEDGKVTARKEDATLGTARSILEALRRERYDEDYYDEWDNSDGSSSLEAVYSKDGREVRISYFMESKGITVVMIEDKNAG
ncbi:MAG: hypothetical protein IKX06_03390 [Clostridia bacterium]|nr:hypothetical protein [Clostridia bacterium]